MDAVKLTDRQIQPVPTPSVPRAAGTLRVSIVSDAITGRNGVGTYYPDLLQHLRPFVDAIELVAPDEDCQADLERFSLPMPGDKTQRLAWPRKPLLYQHLDEFAPNVVVIPSLGAYSYYAMRYAQSRNIPFAIVNHTNFDHLLSLYWPNWLASPFRKGLRKLNRWLCREASAVAAMNVDAFQEANDAGSPFVRVMGTPLAWDFLNTPVTALSEEISQATFVGRLAAEKGVQEVLTAAHSLPHIEFTVAGDGPLRKQVESASRQLSNLRYLGWVSREQVLHEIDRCQLLMLPSIFETFGTVALEALARRRLVLASQDCGIAKWPSLSSGIFYISSNEDLGHAIRRLELIPQQERLQRATKSWNAVRNFNEHTIRTWLRFLADAATKKTAESCRPSLRV